MEINNFQSQSLIYNQISNEKTDLLNIDKKDDEKSSFENDNSILASNESNNQDEYKATSSINESLDSANFELNKSANLNRLFLQSSIEGANYDNQ